MNINSTGRHELLTRIRTHGPYSIRRCEFSNLLQVLSARNAGSLCCHVDRLAAEVGSRIRGAGNVG